MFVSEYATKPEATLGFSEKSLEALKIAVQQQLTREFVSGVQITDSLQSAALGLMTDTIVHTIVGKVWSDPSQEHRATHEITTPPVYKTWKHQLLDSLPRNSFRFRFLSLLWEIEDPEPEQKNYTVEVYVPAVLPEMQRQFPDDFGRLHFPITVTAS